MISRNLSILLLFAFVFGALLNWGRGFTGRDETRVAGIAREMAITKDYLVPRLNGEVFSEYPPLGYWLPAFIFTLTDSANAFPIHLSGVLFCLLTVSLTFQIGKMFAGERIGLLSGVFLQLSALFLNLERTLIVDTPLLFFLTLSMFALCRFYLDPNRDRNGWKHSALFYLGIAGGFLCKGLIGAGIPVLIASTWFAFQKDLRWLWKLLFSPALVFFFLPIFIWAGALWISGQTTILLEVFTQSLNRYGSASVDHIHGVLFYLGPLFYNFLPGSFLFLLLSWLRFGPSKRKNALHFPEGFVFAWVCFLSILLLLLFSLSKRVLYLGPLLPAFSIMSAFAWENLCKYLKWTELRERALVTALSLLMILGNFLFFAPRENEESYFSFFESVKQLGVQRKILLHQPSERLRGATVLYLGQTTPMTKSQEELEMALSADTKPKLLLLSSSVSKPRPINDFSDSLVLLIERTMMKERIQVYAWD